MIAVIYYLEKTDKICVVISHLKLIVVLLLSGLIAIQSLSSVIICADFFINQSKIIREICINKDRPQLHCNGKCHLKKLLEKEDHKSQSPNFPVKEKYDIQLFAQQCDGIVFMNEEKKQQNISFCYKYKPEEHIMAIFHPPCT